MQLVWDEQQGWLIIIDGAEQLVADFDPVLAEAVAGLDGTATDAELAVAFESAGYVSNEGATPPAPPGGAPAPPAAGGKPEWWETLRGLNPNIPAFEDLGFATVTGSTPTFSLSQYSKDFRAAKNIADDLGLTTGDEKGMTFEEAEALAASRPGFTTKHIGNDRWDLEAEPGVFRSQAEAATQAAQSEQLVVPQGDGTFILVDPTKPLPPLRFDNLAAAQVAARAMGPGFRVGTSGGFFSVERGPATGTPQRRSLSQTIDDLVLEGRFNEALALDAMRDALNATPPTPEAPAPTGFTLEQATEIAQKFAASADNPAQEFEAILQDLLAIDIGAEARGTLEEEAPSLFERPGQGAGALGGPPSPASTVVGGERISGPPSIPGSAQDIWQRTFNEERATEIANGETPEAAEQFARAAANAALAAATPTATASTGGFSIPGFGRPVGADPNLAASIQFGTLEERQAAIAQTTAQQGFTVLDTGELSARDRTRLFRRQIPDDDLLDTISNTLSDEEIANLRAGGPSTSSNVVGPERRRLQAEHDAAGNRPRFSDQDLANRFGVTRSEVAQLRKDAQRRKDAAAVNRRGFATLGRATTATPAATATATPARPRGPGFTVTRFRN